MSAIVNENPRHIRSHHTCVVLREKVRAVRSVRDIDGMAGQVPRLFNDCYGNRLLLSILQKRNVQVRVMSRNKNNRTKSQLPYDSGLGLF